MDKCLFINDIEARVFNMQTGFRTSHVEQFACLTNYQMYIKEIKKIPFCRVERTFFL